MDRNKAGQGFVQQQGPGYPQTQPAYPGVPGAQNPVYPGAPPGPQMPGPGYFSSPERLTDSSLAARLAGPPQMVPGASPGYVGGLVAGKPVIGTPGQVRRRLEKGTMLGSILKVSKEIHVFFT